uniref:Uncharacterized protein n=1 Tax=Globisporangium ultimum (strain ATCC 200006 / CBS 805.95 / DAOM BR144) TaxID=431595 RepID=K3WDN2_GLOUD
MSMHLPQNIFYRLASIQQVSDTLDSLREQVLKLMRYCDDVSDEEQALWANKWFECQQIRGTQMAFQLAETRNLQEIMPDRATRIETLTCLKYELAQSSRHPLVSDAYSRLSNRLDVFGTSVLEWFISSCTTNYRNEDLQGEGTFGAVFVGTWNLP